MPPMMAVMPKSLGVKTAATPWARRSRASPAGMIPPTDAASLHAEGVAAVFTPRDFGITAIVGRIVDEIRLAHKLQPWAEPLTMKG